MKITFERTGGFMGRKISLSLNVDELSPEHSATLRRLVDESGFFGLEVSLKKTSPLDEFHYAITVTTKTVQHTVRTGDSSIPETLRPLVNELLAHARRRE